MVKKYKYGPLVWNTVDEENDSGNYWWPGSGIVAYDKTNIPIDSEGLQCLPMSSPVHPHYEPKDYVFNKQIKDYLPSFKEWQEWFDVNFIEINEDRIKREILRWYVKERPRISKDFVKLQNSVENIDEMVDAVWPLDENK